MQKQEHFERYTPQYPLPVDITDMSRQDTVCQFCGVSYLIHNEIKILEEKCQKLENDLAYYAGINSRESDLEQKLQNEKAKVSDLESTININTHKFNEIKRKLDLIRDEYEQSERAHRETKANFSISLSNLQLIIHQIRKEYLFLQDFYFKNIQNWKIYLQTIENTLQKEIQTISNNHRMEIEQYRFQLKEINQTFQQSQFNSKESYIIIQNDLERSREELKLQQNEISRLREQLSQSEQIQYELKNNFEQSKQYSQQLEKELIEKNQSNKNLDLLIDQYRQEVSNEKELRLKTNSELENLRFQLRNESEQTNIIKNDFENNEINIRKKFDEMNRSRQAVLDRTRDEYEKLLRKYTDLDEIYRELVDLREKDMSESKKIRFELQRLHNDNIELNKQRETLNITHDIQIKKLHDSYSNKLHELEQWPNRLQSELNREREQHRLQIHDIETKLKESFLTELNIEKQKFSDLLRKYEHDSDYSTKQLRHELISTEKVTIEQRQYYTKQIEQLENDKEYLKQELDKLRETLKDLHEQLNKKENQSEGNNLELKEDLIAKEKSLYQAQTIIDQLQKELDQTRDEMITLQETVHKECTEREGLKDALIDARQQLLTLKKNGILNGTASRSLHSPPIAFEEIEKRVTAPLPHTQIQHRNKIPSFVQSEPITRGSSIPDEAADLTARPMSTSKNVPYRSKALPPIIRSQQQKTRRNGNRSDQLLENQRRIARFIKHIK